MKMDEFENEEKVVEKRGLYLWHLGSKGTLGYCAATGDHELSEYNVDLDPDFWPNDD